MKTQMPFYFLAGAIMSAAVFPSSSAFGSDQVNQPPLVISNSIAVTPTVTPQSFVWDAASTDLKEIEFSQVALNRSQNHDVKDIARRMIKDHTKSYEKVTELAKMKSLPFPDTNSLVSATNQMGAAAVGTNADGSGATNLYQSPTITHGAEMMSTNVAVILATNQVMEVNLNTLSGVDFDRAYVTKLIRGHETAVRTFDTAEANLSDADLKKFARKTLPTLRKHLHMLQELQVKIGEWSNDELTNSVPPAK